MIMKGKKRTIIFTLLLCIFFLFAFCACEGETGKPGVNEGGGTAIEEDKTKGDYYFDGDAAVNGDGSYERPFNTLEEIKNLSLIGGNTVCFKGTFYGSLLLENIDGTEQNRILFTSYGGGIPVIDGNGISGENTGVLKIVDCNFITVENMEITDSSDAVGDKRGILVVATGGEEIRTYRGIELRSLTVRHIKGTTDDDNKGMSALSKRTGGIQIWTDDGMGRFDGISVVGCRISDVDNVGIATWYKPGITSKYKISPYDTENFALHAYTNVLISGNRISQTGKNGIFVRNLLGGRIEDNVVSDTCRVCYSGNSICTSYVDGTIVQRNEGYRNLARVDESGKIEDGCMLDADLQSKDVVFQYNYSHDNAFGLFETCTDVRDHVTVRYNLSVADNGNTGIVYLNYDFAKVDFYNNTIVCTGDTSPVIVRTKSNRTGEFNFFNNIIYNSSASAKINATFSSEEYNYVFNNGLGKIAYLQTMLTERTASPKFSSVAPNEFSKRCGKDAARFAILKSDSPALNTGKEIYGVKEDFFGNAYSLSIGCSCKSA